MINIQKMMLWCCLQEKRTLSGIHLIKLLTTKNSLRLKRVSQSTFCPISSLQDHLVNILLLMKFQNKNRRPQGVQKLLKVSLLNHLNLKRIKVLHFLAKKYIKSFRVRINKVMIISYQIFKQLIRMIHNKIQA